MKTRDAIGLATIAAGILAMIASGDDDERAGEDSDDGTSPRVGFRDASGLQTINLDEYEDDEPMCGKLYQVARGDTFLGNGAKSITWRAIFRLGIDHGLPDKDAHSLAQSVGLRRGLAELISASTWNDALYGTWGYGRRDLVGPHGRAIPLSAVHADNRELMRAGKAPQRGIELGEASWKGLGTCTGVTGAARPYLWIPAIDVDAAMRGEATTEGTRWEGPSEISVIEPPPQVWLIGAPDA